MVTAGRRRRARTVAIALFAFVAFMHLLAYAMVGRFANVEFYSDKVTLVVITGCLLLSWSLMVSQAMESVTRAFYARSDLDLIYSVHLITRNSFGLMTRKLSVTESQRVAQFRGTASRRKPSVALANRVQVA